MNPAFEKITGLEGAVGRTIRQLVPEIEDWWVHTYAKVVSTGESARFQQGSMAMGRVFDAYATRVGPGRFVVLFTDITAQKRAEQEREQYVAEIESLNVRLASIHDLLTHQAKADITASVVSARTILQHLIPILEAMSGDRHIRADIAEVMLPIQQATSISLLVSECVSNALKHGNGDVEVILAPVEY